MKRQNDRQSIALDPGFLVEHQEPGFRLLALAVLGRAMQDAVREARGFRTTIYNQRFETPTPLRWLTLRACEDWCEAANVDAGAFRDAVRRACASPTG